MDPALKKPLEFGNRDQIIALQRMELEAIERENRDRRIKAGEIQRYRVELEYSGTATVKVWATSRSEAEEIALEEPIDYNNVDVENARAYLDTGSILYVEQGESDGKK